MMSEPHMSEFSTDASTTWRPRLSPKARLRWDRVEKRYMLVFPEAALLLNETAPEILKLCDGEHTVEGIVDALAQRFTAAERQAIEADVVSFLTRLRARGLLEA
jgi:pyrroloquinoline quinone biosynthesis protein D